MVRIIASPRMASLTSLHLGGRALALATFESAADLETLPEAADRIGGRVAMLGGGTNILAADGELPVVLVRCGMDEAPAVIGEDGGEAALSGALLHVSRNNGCTRLVRVGAGVKLPRLLVWCMKHGLSGLEGMAGVPGDVGGAVAGNAGAHGMDMGTVLRSVDVFSPDRGFRTLGREDVRCEYRFFGLKDGGKPWFAISSIVLALRPAEPEAIRTALRDNIERKLRVQPVRSWSAGCVFKNPPEGTSAGKLLDEAGFRGKRLGGMCFSEIHANFLVNEGKGSADAALELIRSAQSAVWERFGIQLQTEVKLWVF